MKLLIRCFPRLRFQEMQFNHGARAYVDLKDSFCRQYFRTKIFEPEFYAVASPLIPKGGCFFDLGANFGLCTFGLLSMRPSESIQCYMFEANSQLLASLKRSKDLYPVETISIQYGCISNQEGFSRLEVDDELLGSGYVEHDKEGSIPNIVMDDFIAAQSITAIDLMKIDLEGVELEALQGCGQSMQRGVVKSIYIEISKDNLARAHADPEACLDLLRSSGFSLYWCKPKDLERRRSEGVKVLELHVHGQTIPVAPIEAMNDVEQTDILAVHESLQGRVV